MTREQKHSNFVETSSVEEKEEQICKNRFLTDRIMCFHGIYTCTGLK